MRILFTMMLCLSGCDIYLIDATPIEFPEQEKKFVANFFMGTIDPNDVSFYIKGKYGPELDFTERMNVFWLEKQHYEQIPESYRGVMVHEMMHVYQNVWFGDGAFRHDKSYYYTLLPERHLTEYGVEQQADIIAEYYRVVDQGLHHGSYCLDCDSMSEDQMREILTRRYVELLDVLK